MILETARLILRPWSTGDAGSLYEYAKDPLVGPSAGWPVHTSVENSLQIIREVLQVEENYAVTIRGSDAAVGTAGLMIGDSSKLGLGPDEAEIGYWIGAPFWGRGYIPEAVHELMRHAFLDLGTATLWCAFFEDNAKSQRVAEKCGFRFHHTLHNLE